MLQVDLSPPATLLPVCLLVASSRAVSARRTWPTTKSPPSKVSRRSKCASLKKVLFSFAARSRMSLSGSNTGTASIFPNSAGVYCCRLCFFWHRVVTKLSRQRMTPQQPLQPHPRPPHHAKPLNRPIRVHRARRFEPAAPRKQNRQVHLIDTHRRQRRFHRHGLILRRRRRWDRLQSVLFSRAVFAAHTHQRSHALFINRTKSAVKPANSALATLLFG
jgi:hypothetical protein